MGRDVWFELVDRGKKPLAHTDGVFLPADAIVLQLRRTLMNPKKYKSKHFKGIDEADVRVYDNSGQLLDADMTISLKGDTKDRALVVEVPKLWYQLFAAGMPITGPTSAPLSDSSSVGDLRNAVEATHGETHLRGIAASDLKVYANLDAYEKKEDPMEFTRALVGCGVDPNCFVVVEVPSKRQKTIWTTSSFDLTASTAPSLDNFQQPIWKFNADLISGFKVEYSSDKLILSCRQDVNNLFWFLRDGVLRDGQCGFVLGPPGSGKSAACAAFGLALMRTDWVVTWMHIGHRLSLAFVRLEGGRKKTAILQKTGLTMNDLKEILYEVQGKHFVFLDGFTGDDYKEEILCNEWLLDDRENRRLVLVSCVAFRGKSKMDEDTELNLKEHFVSSWTLDEYFKAIEDDELFEAVEPRLDASHELDPIVVASNDGTVSHSNGEMVLRQEYVKSKYFFAGGSVRYMFGYPTARAVAEMDKAVKALSNATAYGTVIVGDCSTDAINRLYRGFQSLNRQGFISRGGVTLYDGANEIYWPEDTIHTFNPLDITQLPVAAGWLKPLKYNQGGYDAVYIDRDHGLVRFVQVTLAHKHSFRIRYFSELLELLSKSSSSFEVETLEIFFVIDQRVLKDFTFPSVSGEGLLAAFPGWEKNKEKYKIRRVGIQGVDSWEHFDW